MPPEAARGATRSVMLMTTYECQLRCSYCRVRRGPRRMDERTARRGADLLLSSRAESLLLNFFGGEPLLAWDLVRRTALYARAGRAKRPLCRACPYDSRCLGVPAEYARMFRLGALHAA